MAPALDRGDDGSAESHARTPAQRHAQFRDRQSPPELTSFRALYDFEFDDFQVQACTALNEGNGVLVAAPTGSGKTVVGEFAVHLALERGLKCFYTTPIKALSNQKYADLVRRYDSRNVGLLTGDNSVNGEAAIVVMTTEVLRNMLYAGSATLNGLGYVVLDEVHYLADRSRGAVWEEVIIHLPESVRVVALSATVSNAEEFGDWLDDLRGGVTVIVDEHRPVPLWQHMMAGNRLYDLFTDPAGTRVNPELMRLAQRDRGARQQVPVTGRSRPARGGRRGHPGGRSGRGRAAYTGGRSKYADGYAGGQGKYAGRSGGGPSPGRARPPYRPEVVSRLDAAGLLPAIEFIFSRAGCDGAVQQCLAAGLRLTQPDEAVAITEFVERRAADIPDEDLAVLGYREWLTGLQRGIAAHHAGLLPTFKEVVEELFSAGLVRVVFATETLALGINMPGPDRRHREAGQVERRDARRADPGGVHPADRAGRAPRHRRRGARRGAVAARHRPAGGRRPRRNADLPAELQLPAVVQHGRQPDGPGRPGPGRRPARVVVRPVPGGPRRPGPDAAGPPQQGSHG